MLASGSGAWAANGPEPRRGTVPTPTPKAPPTATRTPDPGRPPTPTRVIPPTRTPCVNCAAPVPATESAAADILVNVGGEEYTDGASQVWQADQEYVEGLTT